MRAHTRPLSAHTAPGQVEVDLEDVARGDGYLFVRNGVGLAGRGEAARVPLADVPSILAAIHRKTWIGSAIILAAGVYIARREAALARVEAGRTP